MLGASSTAHSSIRSVGRTIRAVPIWPMTPSLPSVLQLLRTFYGWKVRKRVNSIDNDRCHCIALQAYSQHLENFEKDKKGRQIFLNCK